MGQHECMVARCPKKVDAKWAICVEHWRMIPRDLTDQLARSYTEGMTLETMSLGLRRALVAIDGWLVETFGGEGKRHDPGMWERLCRMVRTKDATRKAIREATPANATASINTAERRPDGWPLCPRCGFDELYSLANPPSEETIVACSYCNWHPPKAAPFRHLSIVP